MKILFIGMGYVGTTMGVVLANAGHQVTGLDINQEKINSLQKGKLYFHEPGLQDLLLKEMQNQRIRFTSDSKEAIENNDLIFITVGTPSLENGNADLTYVRKVAQMIGQYKNTEKTVIVKSTVPIGTTEKVKQWIDAESTEPSPVNVAMNPEFLREGSALEDALYPDRIVIGSSNEKAAEDVYNIYQKWSCPILQTTTKAAEMIKYASNAFLATKISFINEIAKLCDQLQVNVHDVSEGMGLDERIGPAFLQAGLGYGGSCFPKDVKELLWSSDAHQVPLHILRKVEMINQTQPQYFLQKVKDHFPALQGKRMAVLGLSFKPHTDDTRESVSFPVIKQLLREKANVTVHDPVVNLSEDWTNQGVVQCSDPYEAVKEADAILICTNWPHYRELDWAKIRKTVRHPYIFDGRNMLNAESMKRFNYHYQGIGYA